jgi:hypothetical protein
MGRPPIGVRAMTGAERVRRYRRKHKTVTRRRVTKQALCARIRELEAEVTRLKAGRPAAAAPAPDPARRRLVWQRKAHEASGMASDAVEYIVAQIPDTDEFEVSVYEDSGDFRFIGDGFHSMAEAEQAAEQHNAARLRV